MHPAQLESVPGLAGAYAAAVYGVMLLSAWLLLRFDAVKQGVTTATSRYGSLDGLRGILAVGVLVHHSVASYGYFTTGQWRWSHNALLNQLGQSTVALFFMITGFLFALKAGSRQIDWKALYLSRLARLGPLYAVVVAAVFAVVFALSGGVFREPIWVLGRELAMWLTFVVFGRPDINGQPMSWALIAGVNWSLRYEVLFYVFGVPLLHFAARVFTARTLLALTLGILAALFVAVGPAWISGDALYAAHFLGGIATAFAFQWPAWRAVAATRGFKSAAALAVLAVLSMNFSYNAVAVVCLTVAFAAVVQGASVFGLLNTRAAIWLGDISYGIYLIHGLVLWLTMAVVGHFTSLAALGLLSFCSMTVAVAAAVTLLASLSYIGLERRVMLRVAGKPISRREMSAAPL